MADDLQNYKLQLQQVVAYVEPNKSYAGKRSLDEVGVSSSATAATEKSTEASDEVNVVFGAYQNRSTTTLAELKERVVRNEVFPSNKRLRPNNKEYSKEKKTNVNGRVGIGTCGVSGKKMTKHSYGDFVDAPLLPDDQQQLPPQPRRRPVIRAPAPMHAKLPRRQFFYIHGRRVMPSIREAALESQNRNLKKTVANLRKIVDDLKNTVADLRNTVADLQAKLEHCNCQP